MVERNPNPHQSHLLFAAITGRPSPADPGDVRGMIIAAFGTDPKGRPNTRAAAQALGVSQRQVQRWVAADPAKRARPKAANSKKIRSRARSARATTAGRRRALAPRARDRQARYGARVITKGYQNPRGYEWERDRQVSIDLTAEEVLALREAYINNGDAGILDYLEGRFDEKYVQDWAFGRLDRIDINDL